MGWAGYFEDNWDRLQESIAVAEEVLASTKSPAEEARRAGRQALGDAKVMLEEIFQHLELATSPELDLAHQVQQQKLLSFMIKADLEQAKRDLSGRETEILELAEEIDELKSKLTEVQNENAELLAKNLKLESSEYWHAQIKKYLSKGTIGKSRRR